jgi:hypothetical protein
LENISQKTKLKINFFENEVILKGFNHQNNKGEKKTTTTTIIIIIIIIPV